MEIKIAEHAGFCFGVKKAVDTVYDLAKDPEVKERIGYTGTDNYFLPQWTVGQIEELYGLCRAASAASALRACRICMVGGEFEGMGDFRLLLLAFLAIGQKIIRKTRAHDTSPCQCQRHSACVYRDPTPSPLLRNIRRRSRTACRIKDKIAWIGGHQDATLD